MAEGYEDIDRLVNRQGQMLDESLQKQNDIINRQTQMQVDSLARQKEDIDKETTQQNRAIYQDYRKATNPFGQQAENLAGQGLANSGYAETTQARLYNTYQNNITSTLNNARDLKADVDFQINQARQTGDITIAQNALELYKQKMQLLSEEYDLRNNREQFLYQKSQDALAQTNWQKEFDYQKSRDKVSDKQWNKTYNYNKSRDKVSDKQWQTTFDYQKSRDKVSDTHWEKEYALSKKAKASSGYRKSSKKSSKKKSSSKTASINLDGDNKNNNSKKTDNDALKNLLKTADALIGKTKKGKAVQELSKEVARQYLVRSAETKALSYEKAKEIYKKLGLEN